MEKWEKILRHELEALVPDGEYIIGEGRYKAQTDRMGYIDFRIELCRSLPFVDDEEVNTESLNKKADVMFLYKGYGQIDYVSLTENEAIISLCNKNNKTNKELNKTKKELDNFKKFIKNKKPRLLKKYNNENSTVKMTMSREFYNKLEEHLQEYPLTPEERFKPNTENPKSINEILEQRMKKIIPHLKGEDIEKLCSICGGLGSVGTDFDGNQVKCLSCVANIITTLWDLLSLTLEK